MLISDIINNKEEISTIVINELKELGVKYRKEKKVKVCPEKPLRKRIFRTHLHLLELTDVVLSNGGIVQIPQFVSDACQRILEHVEVEGLFRKAGSSIRQKEIRKNLESGLQLGKNYHVIDVANVLKSFFRELPEPLLPSGIQETFIRSLLIGDDRIKAILMSCLLLPPLSINTLAFFMQFLYTISLNSHLNKMSIDNLAIIFTPGLMPVMPDKTAGIHFNNHVKILKILIENAEMIGVLPDNIKQKLNLSTETMITSPLLQQKQKDTKKKKRRSGSLTRVFNGLRKFVGVIGSSENLENTPDINGGIGTPCLSKSAKKRKLADNAGFSAKKKKEILDFMPAGNGLLLPNTPYCMKEVKKSRLSLGGRKNLKYQEKEKQDKRWSIVGSNWARKRDKIIETIDSKKSATSTLINQLPPVISMPCISNFDNSLKTNLLELENSPLSLRSSSSHREINSIKHHQEEQQEQQKKENNDEIDKLSNNYESDYVRISKSEYEEIKERVAAIETRISQEFGTITNSICNSSMTGSISKLSSPVVTFDYEPELSGPEKVLSKFEKTIEETESMTSSPSTNHLAKRLSRELKIRRSAESRVFRSPSQRKIGNIRRRSRENSVSLSRNNTWHISSSKVQPSQTTTDENLISQLSFYPKNCLKRGRPNTVQTGLQPPVTVTKDEVDTSSGIDKENWIAGELFFDNENIIPIDKRENENISQDTENVITTTTTNIENIPSVNIHIQPITPKFITRITINDNIKTPMLPPKSIPKRTLNSKTPLKPNSNMIPKKLLSTPIEETQNGRASIARLRAQNAGMVLAKAKLFDGLGNNEISDNLKTVSSSAENRRKSARFIVVNKAKQLESEWKTENMILTRLKDNNELQQQRQQTLTRQSRTPIRGNRRTLTPKYAQKRSRFSIATTDNKFTEKVLLGELVNEGQITSKGDRNKVTVIRNISNTHRSLDSPNRYTSKIKRTVYVANNGNSGVNSPRRLVRTAR